MNNLSRMNVFKPPKQLIKEKLVMFFSEWLITLDDLGQISVHHF